MKLKNKNAMKTALRNNMSLSVIFGIFLLPLTGLSMKETEKTITKEATVSPATIIRFETKLGPVKVETWEQNKVKLVTTLTVDGKEEDVARLIDLISDIQFVSSENELMIVTKFYSSYTENFPGGIKIVLNNGTILWGITKLKISYLLTIPRENPLGITVKYEHLELPDLTGNLDLQLYEGELQAGSVGGKATIDLKYTRGSIGSLQDAVIKLYESKLEVDRTGDLTLNSKYSDLMIRETGNVQFESYEDKLTFSKHLDVNGKAKYTTLFLADFPTGGFDLYECKLTSGTAGTVEIRAKYSSLTFASVEWINFSESYEVKFSGGSVGALSAASKYGVYTITHLGTSLAFRDSYEDAITIDEIGNKFNGLTISSKYTDLDMTFEKGTPYQIDATMKYTELIFPESAYREIRNYKDGSDHRYQGIVKGADEKTAPVVNLNMYEGTVKLK